MATETEFNIYDSKTVHLLANVPLIADSLSTVDALLGSNTFLGLPYALAKSASNSTIRSTEPLQHYFAAYLNSVDGILNSGLTQVAEKLPFAFEAHPEDVASMLRERSQLVTDFASKTFDERVMSPTLAVVGEIDSRVSPLVDLVEKTLPAGPVKAAPAVPDDAKFMTYSRALALSQGVLNYSAEQFTQLQEHNALLHSVTTSVHTFASLAQTSVTFANVKAADARAQLEALTATMLGELNKIQENTIQAMSSLQARAQELPGSKVIMDLYKESLVTVDKLKDIALEDSTWGDKANKLTQEVQEKLKPILVQIQATLTPKA